MWCVENVEIAEVQVVEDLKTSGEQDRDRIETI